MSLLLHLLASLIFLPAPSINVTINSTGQQKGEFHLAVYANAADYEAKKTIAGAVKPAANGSSVSVTLPAGGDYVISGYHDVNGNGELDFNMLGIPKEPYGFVTLPDSKYKAPAFSEIATPVTGGESVVLEFKFWREF